MLSGRCVSSKAELKVARGRLRGAIRGKSKGKSLNSYISTIAVFRGFEGKGSRVQEFGAGGVLALRAQLRVTWGGVWVAALCAQGERWQRSGSLKAEHQRRDALCPSVLRGLVARPGLAGRVANRFARC